MQGIFQKMQLLENLSKEKSLANDSSLTWQYLFLALYWYAKAELTLINRQNSLNDFTLIHIYSKLLKFTLNEREYECLHFIQVSRDSYKNGEYMECANISFLESFTLIKKMLFW